MTAALDKASGDSDSLDGLAIGSGPLRQRKTYRAFADDHCDRWILCNRLSPQCPTLHTCPDSDSTACVPTGASPFVDKCDVLEAVRVDDEGAPAGTSTGKVVSGVPDEQAEVVFPCKVNARLDMGLLGRLDVVDTVVAE